MTTEEFPPSANLAYKKARRAGKRLPELEHIILTSLFYSYFYAMDVIKDRWIEAEDIIMLDPVGSYLYAVNLIKGKLPDKMHNMMILHGIEDPSNSHVISYFKFIENPVTTSYPELVAFTIYSESCWRWSL